MDLEFASGTPAGGIVLAGHSQGGALALYAAATYANRNWLAGVASLGSWMPLSYEVANIVVGTMKIKKVFMVSKCRKIQ